MSELRRELQCCVFIGMVTILLLFAFEGCQKNNPVDAATNSTATHDAAMSIANALAKNNGGAFDQVSDVAHIASSVSFQNETGAFFNTFTNDSVITSVSKTYDSTSGWWTLTLFRHRIGDNRVSELSRTYQYQFLNKNNAFQQFWLTGTDTAYSIRFKIVSGTGYSIRPRIRHHLISLTGEWLVTGTNTNIITINTVNNGPYTRVGSDTINTDEAVRTLNYTLSLTFTNVTVQRGSGFDDDEEHAGISGTITGTYDASVTFTKGSLYRERTIHETISITLGGEDDDDDIADLRLGDLGGNFLFRSRIGSGDVD